MSIVAKRAGVNVLTHLSTIPGASTPPLNYYRANIKVDLNSNLYKKLPDNLKLPPGLLLFGENDVAIHFDSVKNTTDIVKNLTIELIKDASHFCQQDDPESVNRLMHEFLDKLPNLKKEQLTE